MGRRLARRYFDKLTRDISTSYENNMNTRLHFLHRARKIFARIFGGHALLVRAKYQVCGAGAQREHSVQTYDKCTSYLPICIIYKY